MNLLECSYYPYKALPSFLKKVYDKSSVKEQREIELHRLFYFLHFTKELEIQLVNRAFSILLTMPFLDKEQKDRCIHFIFEESLHAKDALELQRKLEKTKIKTIKYTNLPFIDYINKLDVIESHRDLLLIVFALVTETAITSKFRVFKNSNLPNFVIENFNEHQRDEAKHQLFFTEIAQELLKYVSRYINPQILENYIESFKYTYNQIDVKNIELELKEIFKESNFKLNFSFKEIESEILLEIHKSHKATNKITKEFFYETII